MLPTTVRFMEGCGSIWALIHQILNGRLRSCFLFTEEGREVRILRNCIPVGTDPSLSEILFFFSLSY